jgi:phage shock protein PspC (stress-responsive transcriptional regulator)
MKKAGMRPERSMYRPDKALLAGVCAELAQRLGWDLWAIRVLVLIGLLLAPLAVGGAYLLAALLMQLLGKKSAPARPAPPAGLGSAELGERGERIAELERKFRELERREGR